VAVPIVFVAGLLTGTGEAAGAAPPGARPVVVAVTDAGCEPAVLRLPAGRASFTVTGRSDRVSEYEVLAGERVLGEAENLAPGITGHFSLTLKPGRYRLECPGGADGSLVVR
jgi:iron uptake system component EfeO